MYWNLHFVCVGFSYILSKDPNQLFRSMGHWDSALWALSGAVDHGVPWLAPCGMFYPTQQWMNLVKNVTSEDIKSLR